MFAPRRPQVHNPAIMAIEAENKTDFRTLHLDRTFLELNPEEEAFFKSETGIHNTEELKKHIIHVQEDAYEVSRCSRANWIHGVVILCFVFRSSRILAFGGSGLRCLGPLGCLRIHASSNWGRTGRMRYFWTSDAAVKIGSPLSLLS